MLRPWTFHLSERIDPRRGAPLYLQIVHALIHEVERGRLVPGAPLPSSRELAESLGVNRKTIVLAYDDLVAQGWFSTDGTRGTFVSAQLPETKPAKTAPRLWLQKSTSSNLASRNTVASATAPRAIEARQIGTIAQTV